MFNASRTPVKKDTFNFDLANLSRPDNYHTLCLSSGKVQVLQTFLSKTKACFGLGDIKASLRNKNLRKIDL